MQGKNTILNSFSNTIELLSDKERRRFYIVGVFSIISSILDIAGLLIVFPAINAAIKPEELFSTPIIGEGLLYVGVSNESQGLLLFFLAVLLVIIAINIFSAYVNYIQAKFSSHIASGLVVSGFSFYLNVGLIELNKLNSGALMRNIVINPVQYSRFVIKSQLIIITEVTIVLMIMGLLVSYDPVVFLVLAFVLIPVTFLFYYSMKNRLAKYGVEQDKVLKRAQHVTLEGLDGFIDLFVYNKKQTYIKELRVLMESLIPLETKMIVIPQLSARLIEIVAFTGVVLLLVYALFFARDQEYFMTLMTVFAIMIYRLMPTYNRILHGAMQIKNYSYLFDIVKNGNVSTHSYASQVTSERLPIKQTMVIKSITYKYPESADNALKDVSISIRKGEKIGIIGQSGSGKTTLVNVILRLIDQDLGQIIIDAKVLEASDKEKWLNTIGYVQQDVFIQEMTIAQNVAFGEYESSIDYSKVQESLQLSNLWDFVMKQDCGVRSVIQERGKNLSGGQKQRLAIARALYRDADLIILDEATSALDNESEKEINESIESLSRIGKTVIIIAHRYTSLQKCDRIYELKFGQIDRVMSYDELVSNA